MRDQPTERGRVFVVDDEPTVLEAVRRILSSGGFDVQTFLSVAPALKSLDSAENVDAILTDLHLPGQNGMELLSTVRASRPGLSVVLITGQATISAAVEAIRSGAFDFVTKPIASADGLRAIVQRAVDHSRLVARNAYLERQLEISRRTEGVIAVSPGMRTAMHVAASVAATDSTVLIRGESGTGKEVIAKTIHETSNRKHRAFVGVNCGALTENLLESELFGHARGAFTGAITARRGLFEHASGGTIFLDEIGELTPTMQVKLLRVLEEREIRPVGESVARPVDVRVLAATHRDLESLIRAGSFRLDLYYRINVISVHVPSLRERPEDILPLAYHFLRAHSEKAGKRITAISPELAELLEEYSWPGNVRELSNCIERVVVLARGEVVGCEALPPEMRLPKKGLLPEVPGGGPSIQEFSEARALFEQNYMKALLIGAQGNLTVASSISGIDRSNLRKMLKRCGINADDYRGD